MNRRHRYQMIDKLKRVCEMLRIDPVTVVRRAGLPEACLADDDYQTGPAEYFGLWHSLMEVSGDPELPISLAVRVAQGPFVSAVFAFSCSPDVKTGLERLALFKPLIGPVRIRLKDSSNGLSVACGPIDPTINIPSPVKVFELVYFMELIRFHTGAHVLPKAVIVPKDTGILDQLEAFFGIRPELGDDPHLLLEAPVGTMPLITRNEELWSFFEADLRRQLTEANKETPVKDQVRTALLHLLPSGQATADSVAERLRISRRSLQRRLQEEGATFQSILDATRADLSLHYLREGSMSVDEISYLLAYRDPNSFYRAFHGWTGMTPSEARSQPTP